MPKVTAFDAESRDLVFNAMDSILIKMVDVWRTYDGERVQALKGIDLEIAAGEWVTIIGPSGSGKTTLLNLMCGLDRSSKGEVFFQNHKPISRAEWTSLRSSRIGYIFQAFHLLPTLTAVENVEIPMFGVFRRARERRARALDLLYRLDLADRAHHLPRNLSGGERQRVAIARSLVNSPVLLLADEPTGNLDSKNALQTMILLEKIFFQEKVTVVMVTHNPMVARRGTRWLKLVDGKVEMESRSEAVTDCYS